MVAIALEVWCYNAWSHENEEDCSLEIQGRGFREFGNKAPRKNRVPTPGRLNGAQGEKEWRVTITSHRPAPNNAIKPRVTEVPREMLSTIENITD